MSPFGCGWPPHAEHASLRRLLLAGADRLRHHQRKRILKNHRRLPLFHRIDHVRQLRRSQRRRLHDQDHVEPPQLDRVRRIDLFDFVLPLQFFQDELLGNLPRLHSLRN